jgi:hypothetical protein
MRLVTVVGRAVAGAVAVIAIVVGVLSAWQWGVAVVVLGILLFGAWTTGGVAWIMTGVDFDAARRWGRAHSGDDPEDKDHWSRRRAR